MRPHIRKCSNLFIGTWFLICTGLPYEPDIPLSLSDPIPAIPAVKIYSAVTMNSLWLQIRSNAPGLPGPFLQEYRNAYQVCYGAGQLAITIGASAGRSPIHNATPLVDDARYGIWLRRISYSTVIADCDLHLDINPDRVRAGPQPGHLSLHQLKGLPTHSPVHIAGRLYAEALFPISCVVVLSVDGLGGVAESARVLAHWLNFSSLIDIQPPPRLLLSTSEDLTLQEFSFALTLAMRHTLGEDSISFSQAKNAWSRRVESIHIVRPTGGWRLVGTHVNEVSRLRKQYYYKFSPPHFLRLLQQVVAAFADRGKEPFDLLRILGVLNPATEQARANLMEFLKTPLTEHRIAVIASSLALTTYSHSSHCMYPLSTKLPSGCSLR
jgi:hypothetical protein